MTSTMSYDTTSGRKQAVGLMYLISLYIDAYSSLKDIIAEHPHTHGSVLIPVAGGSDKTTVLVSTGHQEYHPIYQSPDNFKNTVCHMHGLGVMPVAFLPIPKSMWIQLIGYAAY